MSAVRPQMRDAIVEAAFQTFSARPSASIGDVASQAGIGRATVHRYFASREDLLVALGRTALDEIELAVDEATRHAETPDSILRLCLRVMIPLADRHWMLMHAPEDRDPECAARYQRWLDDLRRSIEDAAKDGVFDRSVPSSWIMSAFDNLIYAAWSNVRSGEATLDQAADLAWRTLTKGLSA